MGEINKGEEEDHVINDKWKNRSMQGKDKQKR